MKTKKANPNAISVRIEPRTEGRVAGSCNHDLRKGRIPKYVDQTRMHLNDTLIEPLNGPTLRETCLERRALRNMKRAIKSNTAVATVGIITFGTQAQIAFGALDRETQNKAYMAVAEAIARRLKTTLTGLVVHRDETADHAHFQLPSFNLDGQPLSQANQRSDLSALQDVAAEAIQRFAPSIERGHKRKDRRAAGATVEEVTHRPVWQMHATFEEDMNQKRADADAHIKSVTAKAIANAQAKADAIVKAAEADANAVVKSLDLVVEGKVIRQESGQRGRWVPTSTLDDDERNQFIRAIKLPMFTSIYRHWRDMLKSVAEQISNLSALVTDLEQIRHRMTAEEAAKVDEAQSALEEPSPY